MTNILCRRHDCVWCDPDEHVCLNTLIAVNERGCEDYDTIFEYPEYQEKFWAAFKDKDGKIYRREMMGKRIEHRGRVFYTIEQTGERESFLVTDAVTGAEVGTFGWVKKHWDAFLTVAAALPDVMSYPGLYNERDAEEPVVKISEESAGLLDALREMYGGGGGE